uniref:Uncharacterized protein n=1 Tax=Oryzias latipes TaxID=8090 RepID=A0A3B3H6I7_ORYLA
MDGANRFCAKQSDLILAEKDLVLSAIALIGDWSSGQSSVLEAPSRHTSKVTHKQAETSYKSSFFLTGDGKGDRVAPHQQSCPQLRGEFFRNSCCSAETMS